MRLIDVRDPHNLFFYEPPANKIPRYAILSHCWETGEEVSLQEFATKANLEKRGYRKIESCAAEARKDGYDYIWVDTCCIDKSSSAELSEEINSMFRWYQRAAVCYAFLADVLDTERPSVRKSKW